MQIHFIKCRESAAVPTQATPMSAGHDLYAANEEPIVIPRGEIRRIPIGIAAAPERKDVVMLIFPRSGLAAKNGIALANAVGVIDPDYRGEIQVPLINHGNEDFTVSCGMRIAQLIVMPVLSQEWTPAESLDETQRGSGGFGSSGLNQ
ncbi:MAG: dUTP diphosphatase [Ruminococcus sp.]|nr:dUTP diphosphatase [Ruminococcus sp.]